MLQDCRKFSPHIVQRTNFLVDGLQALAADRDNRSNLTRFAPERMRLISQHVMQLEKLPNLFEGEPKLLTASDENYSIEVVTLIATVTRVVSYGLWQQTLSFVKPQSLDVDSSIACQLSNMHAAARPLYTGGCSRNSLAELRMKANSEPT